VAEGKCSNVELQEDEFLEERRTVRVLGGESAKSREPSDLTEKHGSYGESVERF
jgi:hypothetical protein